MFKAVPFLCHQPFGQNKATFAFNVKLSKSDISVSGVEVYKVSLPLVATAEKIKEQLDLVLLREACRDALKTAYDWKLVLLLGLPYEIKPK